MGVSRCLLLSLVQEANGINTELVTGSLVRCSNCSFLNHLSLYGGRLRNSEGNGPERATRPPLYLSHREIGRGQRQRSAGDV